MDQILAYVQERSEPWRDVLDAGTGRSSLEWLLQLPCRRWTAVTAESGREEALRERYGESFRPDDRLLVGNWQDEGFLSGERFDDVVADYVLGSVERYAPYFQVGLLARLASLTRSRLYITGLEPYPAGGLLDELARFRGACHLLAGHPTHREFPLDWVCARVRDLGFELEEVERFELFYGQELLEGELGGLGQILSRMPSSPLRWCLIGRLGQLRRSLARELRARGQIAGGFDYLVVARRIAKESKSASRKQAPK